MAQIDVRIQHAVIGQSSTTGDVTSTNDVPKKGEIVFNSDLDNFRVGDGTTAYSRLPNMITTKHLPRVYFYRVSSEEYGNSLAAVLQKIIWDMDHPYNKRFTLDEYNHVVIYDPDGNIFKDWILGGITHYSLETGFDMSLNWSLYTYLRQQPLKTLTISFYTGASGDNACGLYKSSRDSDVIWLNNLIVCPSGYTGTGGGYASLNTTYNALQITGGYKMMNHFDGKYGTTIQMTCVDATNNLFLIN